MNIRYLILWSAILHGSTGCVVFDSRPDWARYSGAYRFDDGSLAVITPIADSQLHLCSYEDGRVLRLALGENGRVGTALGFAAGPIERGGRFELDDLGAATALAFDDGARAARISLPESIGYFTSGDVRLRAKLVLPDTRGPHPVVVLVHGSEAISAVDSYHWPYVLAANGLAAVAYDKRGTGASSGEYTQDFYLLADDVVAATRWAVDQAGVDANRVSLMGFSQAGWVIPLAARRIDQLRAISIHYGVAVSAFREDRWGYVYQLRQRGFGEDAIAKADAINALISQIIDYGDDGVWNELKAQLNAHQDSDWFEALAGSDSLLGSVAETEAPAVLFRFYDWWRDGRPSAPRIWQPEPALRSLDVPQHWILAGEDSSTPTNETAAVLARLANEGLPIEVLTYPSAEHGILEFADDETGKRTLLHFSETYMRSAVEWLKGQIGSAVRR